MTATTKPTAAFFGATGGCGLAVLARCLDAGMDCTALVRTPQKLHSLLSARGVSTTVTSTHLTVIQGGISDSDAVRRTLSGSKGSGVADIIISSIGGTPRLQPSLYAPVTLDNPTICADGMRAILSALKDLEAGGKKPVLVAVSTTGVNDAERDVPWLFLPLYHWFLSVPHKDKRAMETLVRQGVTNTNKAVLAAAVIVRPSLLLDGPAATRRGLGEKKGLRVGTGKAVVGYTVTRESVGGWVFEDVVQGWGKGGQEEGTRVVTLTE